MRIVQGDTADRATTQAYFDVVQAADAVDDPNGPPWSLRRLRGWLEHPSEPAEAWSCGDEITGAVQGWYYLMFPDRENVSRAYLALTVRPEWRRRGIGTALLRHAAGRAAGAGRLALDGSVRQDSAGTAFAGRAGAVPGLVEARRVQVLGDIPAGRVAALREQAERSAGGYSLAHWEGRVPQQYLDRYAAALNAMADAPRDEGHDAWVWDADRVRKHEGLDEQQGRKIYTLVAVHDATGEVAAVTEVEPSRDNPDWGFQLITAVVREHRGHRLGLLAKTAMLDWLAEAEPALERIVTDNAAVNQYMIAINEQLGYRLLPPLMQGYQLPVAAALG
jgi:RimJ/RimL family protein N-acetyltransferase